MIDNTEMRPLKEGGGRSVKSEPTQASQPLRRPKVTASFFNDVGDLLRKMSASISFPGEGIQLGLQQASDFCISTFNWIPESNAIKHQPLAEKAIEEDLLDVEFNVNFGLFPDSSEPSLVAIENVLGKSDNHDVNPNVNSLNHAKHATEVLKRPTLSAEKEKSGAKQHTISNQHGCMADAVCMAREVPNEDRGDLIDFVIDSVRNFERTKRVTKRGDHPSTNFCEPYPQVSAPPTVVSLNPSVDNGSLGSTVSSFSNRYEDATMIAMEGQRSTSNSSHNSLDENRVPEASARGKTVVRSFPVISMKRGRPSMSTNGAALEDESRQSSFSSESSISSTSSRDSNSGSSNSSSSESKGSEQESKTGKYSLLRRGRSKVEQGADTVVCAQRRLFQRNPTRTRNAVKSEKQGGIGATSHQKTVYIIRRQKKRNRSRRPQGNTLLCVESRAR